MSDQVIALLVLGAAGAMIIPIALFVRWAELKLEERRARRTPAE